MDLAYRADGRKRACHLRGGYIFLSGRPTLLNFPFVTKTEQCCIREQETLRRV